MNKEIVTYKQGSFVDFEGKERKVILCAISSPAIDKFGNTAEYGYQGEEEDEIDIYGTFGRKLSVGYAVCTPPDEFSEETGKMKAYGCAKSSRGKSLFATHSGLINTKMVDALLEQEMQHLCENPGAVMYRYSLEEKKFNKAKELMNVYNNLTEDEKVIVSAGFDGADLNKLAKIHSDMVAAKFVALDDKD